MARRCKRWEQKCLRDGGREQLIDRTWRCVIEPPAFSLHTFARHQALLAYSKSGSLLAVSSPSCAWPDRMNAAALLASVECTCPASRTCEAVRQQCDYGGRGSSLWIVEVAMRPGPMGTHRHRVRRPSRWDNGGKRAHDLQVGTVRMSARSDKSEDLPDPLRSDGRTPWRG